MIDPGFSRRSPSKSVLVDLGDVYLGILYCSETESLVCFCMRPDQNTVYDTIDQSSEKLS
jgi:hypothetical protein